MYMIAIRNYLVNCIFPYAIVFDLRELSYEWGNNIWDLFECDQPYATLMSDRSRSQDSDVTTGVFESIEPALDYLRPLARGYQKSLSE